MFRTHMIEHGYIVMGIEMAPRDVLPKIRICLYHGAGRYECETMVLVEFVRLMKEFGKLLWDVIGDVLTELNRKFRERYVELKGTKIIDATCAEEAVEEVESEIRELEELEKKIEFVARVEVLAYSMNYDATNALGVFKDED